MVDLVDHDDGCGTCKNALFDNDRNRISLLVTGRNCSLFKSICSVREIPDNSLAVFHGLENNTVAVYCKILCCDCALGCSNTEFAKVKCVVRSCELKYGTANLIAGCILLADCYVSLIHLIDHDDRLILFNYTLLNGNSLRSCALVTGRRICLFKGICTVRKILNNRADAFLCLEAYCVSAY